MHMFTAMLANNPVADPHEADRIVARFTWSRRFRSAVGIVLGGLVAGGFIAAVVELNRASNQGRPFELFDLSPPATAPDPAPEPVLTPMTTPEEPARSKREASRPEKQTPDVQPRRTDGPPQDDHPAPARSPGEVDAKPSTVPLPFDGAPDYMVIGQRFRARGEHERALRAFEHAAELGAPNADALYWMGRTYQDLGKPIAALNAFRRALHADPNHAEATRALARSLQRQGRTSEALEAYRRYVALEPMSTETIDLITSLEAEPN